MGSPIYTLINAQYTGELAHSTHAELAQWRATVPALAELHTPDDLAELVAADPDLVLGALLDLHQAGSQLAGALLLQRMLPVLQRITKYARDTCTWALDDDRAGAVVATFLSVIATHKSRTNLAGALYLLTLRPITRPAGGPEMLVDHDYLEYLEEIDEVDAPAAQHHQFADMAHYGAPDGEHATGWAVVTWAQQTGVLTHDESVLLARAYLDDTTIAALADELGVAYTALRKRLQRLVTRVRDAIQNQDNTTFSSAA